MPISDSTKVFRQLSFAQRRNEIAQSAGRIINSVNTLALELTNLKTDIDREMTDAPGILTQADRDEATALGTDLLAKIEAVMKPALDAAVVK